MSALSQFFSWSGGSAASDEIPDIFPMSITKNEFVEADMKHMFSKILTDVAERTHGLTDDQAFLLWDNCVKSSKSHGLISMLVKAMTEKRDLFLVYEKAIQVVREADDKERALIEADYKKTASSKVGIFVSFSHYRISDLIRVFSSLEYCAIGSLNKTMNLAAALQMKMNDLRASVALSDGGVAKAQAREMAVALGKGKNIVMDAKDEVVTGSPDMEPLKAAVGFMNQKRAWYLGLPEAYIAGIQTGGLNSTGEGDQKAVERGLKNYFFSIMKPVLESLFNVKVSYKSQDFRQIDQGLEALKTFTIIDPALLSIEKQQLLIDQLFDFDTAGGTDA